jgi:YesN/AraC family two-component response regulator
MKKIRALIVDDEELARKNLAFILHDTCPEVEVVGEAANAKEAKKAIESQDIDLLLLDIEMPNGSGFDLLESLEEPSVSRSSSLQPTMNTRSVHSNSPRLTICLSRSIRTS